MSIMNYWFWFWRSFQVCWTPIQTVLLYKSVTSNLEDWDTNYNMIVLQVRCHILYSLFLYTFIFLLQICSHVLAYTNSCLNPILYAKMSRNFRCGFSQVRRKINKKYTQNLFACCEELKGSLWPYLLDQLLTERADELDVMYRE